MMYNDYQYGVREFYDTTEYSFQGGLQGLPYESKSTDKLFEFLNTTKNIKVISIFYGETGRVSKGCIICVYKKTKEKKK